MKYFITFILIALFLSCKKENSAPSTSQNNNPQQFYTSSTPPVGWQGYAHGVFQLQKDGWKTLYNDTLESAFGSVSISDTLVAYPASNNVVDAGNISLNNIQFNKIISNNLFYYGDSTSNKNYGVSNWVVQGNGSLVGFSVTNNTGFPSFSSTQIFPDTVSLTNSSLINISGISNCDSIEVFVGPVTSPLLHQKVVACNSSMLVITPSDFQQGCLSTQMGGYITFYAVKLSFFKHNGKTWVFRNLVEVTHEVFVKP